MQPIGFYLAKAIAFFLMPLTVIFLLVLIAYVTLPKRHRSKHILSIALILLFALSYAPVADSLIEPLESRYPALHTLPKNTRYIVVLGNAGSDDPSLSITSQLSPEAIVRLSEAIRLFRQRPKNVTLVLSGYAGMHGEAVSHARMLGRLARDLGVPSGRIMLLENPADTEQEAQTVAKRIGDQPTVLVTSAYHMPRAAYLFQRYGLHPVPAPTYKLAKKSKGRWWRMLNTKALRRSMLAWHEYLGMLYVVLRHAINHPAVPNATAAKKPPMSA